MGRETNVAPGRTVVVPDLPAAPTREAGPAREYARYRVSVAEYVRFRADGFLVVRGLVPLEDVEELRHHSEDLMYGRVSVPGMEPPVGATREEIERRYLRIHMLHRALEIHER